jgi:Tfp pilus assembly protein PilO
MRQQLLRMPRELGPAGLAGLALIGLAALLAFLVLEPLKADNASLEARVARAGRAAAARPDSAAHKVAEVYRYLEKKEQATDWLAKLHGIGAATGVQVKSASYRSQSTGGRIVRYELTLPLAGSYPQIREFLQRALAEIPVMSVDQVTLRRESRNQAEVQAELRLTLHMVKS